MSAIVVNRIRLKVPAEDLFPDIEREIVPAMGTFAGFERFSVAKTGDREMTVVIFWASLADAANAASVLGPGLFNTWIAPRAESQDRVVGEIAVECPGS